MGETDRGGKTDSPTPANDASEATDEEATQEARQQTALRELFLILEEDAKRQNKSVNATIRAVPILIATDNEIASYILRINPALVSDGKLNVAVLDLYSDGTHHLQQWVIKAEWTDEKPKITGLDDSGVEEGIRQFRLTEIAEYAGRMLRGKIEKTHDVNTARVLTMRMPPEYSSGIN